jgi:hypothetical protein
MATKKAKIEHFKAKLATDPKWAVQGLLRIFRNQTADEQAMASTVEDNGVGFTGCDAHILTSFANQVKRKQAECAAKGWQIKWEWALSRKQMALLHKRMPKYAAQLLSCSDQTKADKLAEAACGE